MDVNKEGVTMSTNSTVQQTSVGGDSRTEDKVLGRPPFSPRRLTGTTTSNSSASTQSTLPNTEHISLSSSMPAQTRNRSDSSASMTSTSVSDGRGARGRSESMGSESGGGVGAGASSVVGFGGSGGGGGGVSTRKTRGKWFPLSHTAVQLLRDCAFNMLCEVTTAAGSEAERGQRCVTAWRLQVGVRLCVNKCKHQWCQVDSSRAIDYAQQGGMIIHARV